MSDEKKDDQPSRWDLGDRGHETAYEEMIKQLKRIAKMLEESKKSNSTPTS